MAGTSAGAKKGWANRKGSGTSKSAIKQKKYAEFNQLGGKTSKAVRARSLIGAKQYGFSTKAMTPLARRNAITKRKSGMATGKTYIK